MGDPLEQNYSRLCLEIRQAAEKNGRSPDSVRLLAVSKKVPAERLRILWGLGHRLFGENRVQEARAKIPDMPTGGEWHFIGGLQTNKAKEAVEWFDVIESVDRPELAAELQKRAEVAGKNLKVLIEVNVGEIEDEDEPEPVETEVGIVAEVGAACVVRGDLEVGKLESHFEVELAADDFTTVAGLVLNNLGHLPVIGERIEINGLSFEVLEADDRRISRVRVEPTTPPLSIDNGSEEE